MIDYKIITYQSGDNVQAGVVVDQHVIDAVSLTGNSHYREVLGILADWDRAEAAIEAALVLHQPTVPLSSVRLLAPLPRPGAIYCAGANFTDHVNAMLAREGLPPPPDPHNVGLKPWHFMKPATTVVADGAEVSFPAGAKNVDWEVELAVIIGRKTRGATPASALNAVAGYTIANDISARDLCFRDPLPRGSPFYFDWISQKCFDGSCPLGPWIVPQKQIGNPNNLHLGLSIDDVVRQDSNTRLMIFDVIEQIVKLSESLTLYPGDVILTGTPAGCGAETGEFLRPGNKVKSWIEKIGELSFSIV